ncbi:amidohydrolase family protein [Lutimonas sp.]|uniref:amidohydrolase family protein n=1 Tax=Lutimonas sp. TaxID=1872403 RepID=UPI003D9BF6D7
MKSIQFAGFLLLLISLNSYAQFSFDTYALHQLNIIDVNEKIILKDYSIVIHQDEILNILPSQNYVANDSTHSIYLKNKYVVPGLIDAHVHFATDPTRERRDHAEMVLKEMLLTGITSVRDMAGDARALSSLARNTLVGDVDGPNIYYSALMAGPEFFTDPRTVASAQGGVSGRMSYMKQIDSTSNLMIEVAQAKGTGASGIKLYANLSATEIKNIVTEAKKQDIVVWSHAALNPTKPSDVIASGVVSVSHANMLLYEDYLSDKNLKERWERHAEVENDSLFWDKEFKKLDFTVLYKAMVNNDVVLDATTTVLEKYAERPKYTWVYEIGKRIIAQAAENNVMIAAGSDSDQKTFVQYEMKLLVEQCHMSPMEALVAATKHSAKATGILASEGTIEKGKKANLLFLNADPTKDIDQIEDVFMVVKNGKLYKP